jgi:hypothetical protein
MRSTHTDQRNSFLFCAWLCESSAVFFFFFFFLGKLFLFWRLDCCWQYMKMRRYVVIFFPSSSESRRCIDKLSDKSTTNQPYADSSRNILSLPYVGGSELQKRYVINSCKRNGPIDQNSKMHELQKIENHIKSSYIIFISRIMSGIRLSFPDRSSSCCTCFAYHHGMNEDWYLNCWTGSGYQSFPQIKVLVTDHMIQKKLQLVCNQVRTRQGGPRILKKLKMQMSQLWAHNLTPGRNFTKCRHVFAPKGVSL